MREAKIGGRVLVTTMLDHRRVRKGELNHLYQRRWNVEFDIRNIKTTLRMEVLRCRARDVRQAQCHAVGVATRASFARGRLQLRSAATTRANMAIALLSPCHRTITSMLELSTSKMAREQPDRVTRDLLNVDLARHRARTMSGQSKNAAERVPSNDVGFPRSPDSVKLRSASYQTLSHGDKKQRGLLERRGPRKPEIAHTYILVVA